MQSKISFCNGTVVKKDIIRFWPLWAVELFLLQYGNFFSFFSIQNILRNEEETLHGITVTTQMQLFGTLSINTNVVLAAVFSVAAAVLAFGYLSHKDFCYAIHSMPLSRKTLFFSHFIAGLLMLIIPYVLSYIVTGIISLVFGLGMGAVIFGMMSEILLIVFFFYSMSCMVVMLSGNGVISVLIYGVLNVLALALSFMLAGLIGFVSYGGQEPHIRTILKAVTYLTPGYYFSAATDTNILRDIFDILLEGGNYRLWTHMEMEGESSRLLAFPWEGLGKCAVYLLPAIIFCAAAWFLYKKRPLEHTGDMMPFSWSKIIFRIVFSISGGMFLSLLCSGIVENFGGKVTYQTAFWLQILLLLISGIVCYLISEMILSKKFRIWRNISFVQIGIICVIMVILMIFGKQSYRKESIVADENIKEMTVSFCGITYYYKEGEIPKELEKLQRKIMDEGEKELFHYDFDDGNEEYGDISFTYITKDTESVHRWYMLSESKNEELLSKVSDFFRQQEEKEKKMFPESANIESLYSYGFSGIANDTEEEGWIDNIDMQAVLDGVIADIKEGNIEIADWRKYRKCMDSDAGKVLTLNFDFNLEEDDNYFGFISQDICLDEKCVHTLKALETAGH